MTTLLKLKSLQYTGETFTHCWLINNNYNINVMSEASNYSVVYSLMSHTTLFIQFDKRGIRTYQPVVVFVLWILHWRPLHFLQLLLEVFSS